MYETVAYETLYFLNICNLIIKVVLYITLFCIQAHGRPSLRSLVQEWNKMLQKEMDHTPTTKMDAADAFLASLQQSAISSLQDSAKKPPIEILPAGMASLYGPNPGQSGTKKPLPAPQVQSSQPQIGTQLLLEGPTPESGEPVAAVDPPKTETGDAVNPPKTETDDAGNPPITELGIGEKPATPGPGSTDSKPDGGAQSEATDASVERVTESGDEPTEVQSSDQENAENEEQSALATSVSDTQGSAPPASEPQKSNGKETEADAEVSMIDFT